MERLSPVRGETNLAALFPLLVKEWDCSTNAKGPEAYQPYSNAYVGWLCEAGHRWKAKINNRTRKGSGCPYCEGNRPIPGVNDLGTLYPWLKKQWDYENNGDLKPEDVFPKSNKRVAWVCKRGHHWETKIYHRTDGQECPYCTGIKPIIGETDLETLEPGLAQEWNTEGNGGHMPSEYTRFSHYPAWWKCKRDHLYQMPIYRRSRGCGCSVCDGKKIVPGENDLATRAPHLAQEWDYSGNEGVTPNQVALHSSAKFGWVCGICGHEWKATPKNRAAGRNCPKCAGCCVDPDINSIEAVNPHLAEQWDFQRNQPLTARNVAAYDNRDYFWNCDNGHSWKASPANRNKGTGCPYCNGKLPVVGINDFPTICPRVAMEWHPSKNSDLRPENYLSNSHEEIWWRCEAGHEWQQMIYERAKGSKCPYCSGRTAIPGKNDLRTLHPDLTDEWHPVRNKDLKPTQCLPNSGQEVWWLCKFGHEWRKSIRSRVQGCTCPYCQERLPVVGETDLATLCKNLVDYWDYKKNKKSPEECFPDSTTRVWWKCANGHSFRSPIREMALCWRCPKCERKRNAPWRK